jgi:hypothetical protein
LSSEDISLSYDWTVYNEDENPVMIGYPGENLFLFSGSIPANQAVYLRLQATVYATTFDHEGLDSLFIDCSPGSGPDDKIVTTENYPGPTPTPPPKERTVRMLLLGGSSGSDYVCIGTAGVGLQDTPGSPSESHTYKGTSSATFFQKSLKSAGWRWGTETEAANGTLVSYRDECCLIPGTCNKGVAPYNKCRLAYVANPSQEISCTTTNDPACVNDNFTYQRGVYIGPNAEPSIGTTELVLQGPRFDVPAGTPSIDVWSEPEITTCKMGSHSCPVAREGSITSGNATVEIDLIVRQKCSATSTENAITHHFTSTFSITESEHHKKAHVLASNVGFLSGSVAGCDSTNHIVSGRSFKAETKVTWLSGANIKVEHGTGGYEGYSTSFAFAN